MNNNRLNKHKYPGAKRLMLEAQELRENTEDYCAQPLDDNLFEWHFTVRGPPDTAFDGGYYHGRLSFPTEYPMKPPSIILLTPNGRFETNKKICLSISGHHPETWQPSWSVRTALLALIAFMPTESNRAIGSLDFSDEERRKLAIKSRLWCCETCGPIKTLLRQPSDVTERIDRPIGIDSCMNENITKSQDNERIIDKQSDRQMDSIENPTSGNTKNSVTHSDTRKVISEASDEQSQASIMNETATNSNSLQNLVERRRAHPLALVSIFILLSLLILRRVVMVIQS